MTVFAHDLLGQLRGHERAVEVDVDDALPGLIGNVHVVAAQAYAGIDVGDIHGAKLADEIFAEGVYLRLIGHIAVQRYDFYAVAFGHFLCQRLQPRLACRDIHQRHVRAGLRPCGGHTPSDAAGAAGDEALFPLQGKFIHQPVAWFFPFVLLVYVVELCHCRLLLSAVPFPYHNNLVMAKHRDAERLNRKYHRKN